MLTLFYAPHGASTDNELGVSSGHADVPLTELGRQEAEALRQQFARDELDAVYCSDLQRAVATAEIVGSGHNIPILQDARLRECDYGKFTQARGRMIDLEYLKRIREPFPNGESVVMVTERVGAWLREAIHQHNGGRIAVIGHRATRYALEYWCGDQSLETIVGNPKPWRVIPIWRFRVGTLALDLRQAEL